MERAYRWEQAGCERPAGKGKDRLLQSFVGRDKLFAMSVGEIEVLAGESVYKSTKLDCPRGKLAGGMGPPSGRGRGGEGGPVQFLRRELSGSLRDGDVVEVAGNTRSRDEKTVRVVRDGKVVANAHYFRVSDGWLGGPTENCAGL